MSKVNITQLLGNNIQQLFQGEWCPKSPKRDITPAETHADDVFQIPSDLCAGEAQHRSIPDNARSNWRATAVWNYRLKKE